MLLWRPILEPHTRPQVVQACPDVRGVLAACWCHCPRLAVLLWMKIFLICLVVLLWVAHQVCLLNASASRWPGSMLLCPPSSLVKSLEHFFFSSPAARLMWKAIARHANGVANPA